MDEDKIYVGQTALTLTIDTNQNLTGATAVLKYRKPDDTVGEFEDVIDITDAINGIFTWVPATADDLNVAGVWTFWSYITFSDAKVADGDPFQIEIHEPGVMPTP